MFETVPMIGKVWRARKRYARTCKYIDGMLELADEERKYSKELARAVLLTVTAKYSAKTTTAAK